MLKCCVSLARHIFLFLVAFPFGCELIPVQIILQRMLITCSHCLALPFVHMLCFSGLVDVDVAGPGAVATFAATYSLLTI